MRTYDDLAGSARICAHNARIATSNQIAVELWKIAREYQKEAAKLASGKLPDIGAPPYCFAEWIRLN
jgi:hypothetical protein